MAVHKDKAGNKATRQIDAVAANRSVSLFKWTVEPFPCPPTVTLRLVYALRFA